MARKKDDRDDSNGPGRQRDPRDVRRIERLERDKAKLIEDRDHWKRRSEHLEKELEAARRAGRRQAAPFAKDRPQGRGGRPGRRAGAEYGRQGRRREPTQADETHVAAAPTTCPDCGGAVALDRVASQYQEDLPAVHPLVRRFDIEVGHCSQCQRRVQGRHALQTSDALGAAAAQLGPNVAALVVELHTELGMPLEKVVRVLRTQFGLHVTKGGVVRLLHRTADAAAPAYAALREQVRRSPVVTPDETGWRVNALRCWLWAFATPETTVYAICDGRGFDDAAAVLGPDFAGVLVRDGWVAYRGFKKAPHQSCLAHLLRRCPLAYQRALALRSFPLDIVGFSDSIVISAPVSGNIDPEMAALRLRVFLFNIAAMMLTCLANTIPLRAGIDVGDGLRGMFPREVYGPVTLNAYDLESKSAQYPRAVIGLGLMHYLDLLESQNSRTRIAVRDCRALIRVDQTDGSRMLHVLSEDVVERLNVVPHGAYRWVARQQERFRGSGDEKLAAYYTRLVDYFRANGYGDHETAATAEP